VSYDHTPSLYVKHLYRSDYIISPPRLNIYPQSFITTLVEELEENKQNYPITICVPHRTNISHLMYELYETTLKKDILFRNINFYQSLDWEDEKFNYILVEKKLETSNDLYELLLSFENDRFGLYKRRT